jgi:hypothetical protein
MTLEYWEWEESKCRCFGLRALEFKGIMGVAWPCGHFMCAFALGRAPNTIRTPYPIKQVEWVSCDKFRVYCGTERRLSVSDSVNFGRLGYEGARAASPVP